MGKEEKYKGHKVKYSGNRINLTLSGKSYKKVIDLSRQTGLNLSNCVILMMSPCQSCNNAKIEVTKHNLKNDGFDSKEYSK